MGITLLPFSEHCVNGPFYYRVRHTEWLKVITADDFCSFNNISSLRLIIETAQFIGQGWLLYNFVIVSPWLDLNLSHLCPHIVWFPLFLMVALILTFRLRDDSSENLLSNPRNIRKRVLEEKKQILRLCRCKSTAWNSQHLADEVVCEPSGIGDQCAQRYAKVRV